MRIVETTKLQINRQASAEEFSAGQWLDGFLYLAPYARLLTTSSLHVSQVYIRRSTFQAKHRTALVRCILYVVHTVNLDLVNFKYKNQYRTDKTVLRKLGFDYCQVNVSTKIPLFIVGKI
jgi:hypothetical protein